MNNFIDSKEFKDLVNNKTVNDTELDHKVSKLVPCEIKFTDTSKFNPEELKILNDTGSDTVITFVISDNSIDRDSDTINVNGWDLMNFSKNPVMIWAHDYSNPPVARAIRTYVEDGLLKSDAAFAPGDISAFADMIGKMYKHKFLNAVSVGFKPIEWKFVEDDGNRKYGIDYLKQELLEYSAVPVPSNPNALSQAKSAGINTKPMVEWAEKILDGGGSIVLPKDFVEDLRKGAIGEKVSVFLKGKGIPDESGTPQNDMYDKLKGFLDGSSGHLAEGEYSKLKNLCADELGITIPDYKFFDIKVLKYEGDRYEFDDESFEIREIDIRLSEIKQIEKNILPLKDIIDNLKSLGKKDAQQYINKDLFGEYMEISDSDSDSDSDSELDIDVEYKSASQSDEIELDGLDIEDLKGMVSQITSSELSKREKKLKGILD